MSQMGAKGFKEIDILLEDGVAKSLLLSMLPTNIRTRLNFIVIGSASALSRQLAAAFIREREKPVIAVFDGDQKALHNINLLQAKKMSERSDTDFENWFKGHVLYLPGDTWPESWIVQKNQEALETLARAVDADKDWLFEILEYGLQAGKHNEFYEISGHLGLDQEQCLQIFTANIKNNFPSDFKEITDTITKYLNETC